MNSRGDPAQTGVPADWHKPLAGPGRPDPRSADLDARTSEIRGYTAATHDRAETTDASLHRPAPDYDPDLVKVIAAAGRFYQSCSSDSWVPGYLASRGLDAALLPTSPWKIGYATASWTALLEHLRGLGFCDSDILSAGLVVNGTNGQLRDYFHDRLIIPLRAEDGIAVGFIGRRHPDANEDHGPKYLNSPATQMFAKSRILAGLAEGRNALGRGAQPVLTEGPLDAIAVSIGAPGQYAGISPCGTALTGDQVAALAHAIPLADRGVLLAPDGDTAGRKAAVRAYWHLTPVTSKLTTTAFPDGADPASLLQAGGRTALRNALTGGAHPLADLVTDSQLDNYARGRDLVFAELQIGALRAAATAIAAMPADHVGPQAARLCALFGERYGWTPQQVNTEIIDTIERRILGPWASLARGETWHPADSPWAIVMRATAPPRQRPPADGAAADPSRSLRLVQPQSAQRDA